MREQIITITNIMSNYKNYIKKRTEKVDFLKHLQETRLGNDALIIPGESA